MAIAPMAHITLYGRSRQKHLILEELQKLGFLHLISHVTVPRTEITSSFSSEAHEAYLYLKHCPEKRKQAHDLLSFNLPEVQQEALAIKERTRILNDERDYLLRHVEALEPWGDFEFGPLEETMGYRMWFYIVPHYNMKDVKEKGHIWECVFRDNRFSYVVVISPQEPTDMPVPRTHTGDKPLSWLRQRLRKVDEEIEDLYWRRIGLTRWCKLFANTLAGAEDQTQLKRAAQEIYDDGQLFVIEAWSPSKHTPLLEKFTQEHHLMVTARPPAEGELPPTLLENPSLMAGGEQLVRFYTTPGYYIWDPSIAVFLSFVSFFAMIVSDAGYGLLLGGLWLLTRRRLKGSSSPLYILFSFMVGATIGYGILVGSFFGVSPREGSMWATFKILDIQNQQQMMFLSILIGAVHLMVAHAINFYKARERALMLPSIGWIAVIFGGLLIWAESIKMISQDNVSDLGWFLIGGGAFLILCFSSLRPWIGGTWQDRLGRILDGLLALTGISRAFGDVLSYLRLFALGLASAQLAVTFNGLAADVASSIAGIGTLLGILILTFGHGLNFLLVVMSGVVHGLRLNFIEFFNWGMAEEGYPFKPFQKKGI